MADGVGVLGLLTTMCELAGGASTPSVLPVWERNLLSASNPCHITPKTSSFQDPVSSLDVDPIVNRTFSFSTRDITTLRARMPRHLRNCTAFELIAGALWRSRTIALQLDPNEEVCLAFVLSCRAKFSPPIPAGYYGNTVTFATTVSTVGEICDGPFSYAVEQLKKTRQNVTGEYKKSSVDPGVLRSRRIFTEAHTPLIVSDVSMLQLSSVDFGWGRPVYSGPADSTYMHRFVNFIIPCRNENGEEVKVVPVYLPEEAMGRFADELQSLLKE